MGRVTTLVSIIISILIQIQYTCATVRSEEFDNKKYIALHSIEGKVMIIEREGDHMWLSETYVALDGGKYKGYIQQSGSFIINQVPPGSYLVEVVSPNYFFEPVRVDISSNVWKYSSQKSESHNVIKRSEKIILPTTFQNQ